MKLERHLREILKIPTNYHVLFLGGAARCQFAMIPLNFLGNRRKSRLFNQRTLVINGLSRGQ